MFSAGLHGAEPPPDGTWPGKQHCPGELWTCDTARRGASTGPATENFVQDEDEFVARLPTLPKGWFGSLAVPGPWDLPAVPTVPQPGEEVAAVCHAGIPFPQGCQVRAASLHWSRKQRHYSEELGPFSVSVTNAACGFDFRHRALAWGGFFFFSLTPPHPGLICSHHSEARPGLRLPLRWRDKIFSRFYLCKLNELIWDKKTRLFILLSSSRVTIYKLI